MVWLSRRRRNSPGLSNRRQVEIDLYLWGLRDEDLAPLPKSGWIGYLQGNNPNFPLKALQEGLSVVRAGVEAIRADKTTYHTPVGITRWANANPVATEALLNLTMGAADPGGSGHGPLPLHAQLRYFDPHHRRAGRPTGVAALVSAIGEKFVEVTLVNTDQVKTHVVTVQTGGYGEHLARQVVVGDKIIQVSSSTFDVQLAPGAGDTFNIKMKRYHHQPTLAFP
ncbi:MAG: hypothetical protein KTR25_08115 [Myxococcales bacterium]|nr:hypothetical protein [Myxococcales bacterium]